jgi:hypothetical protein
MKSEKDSLDEQNMVLEGAFVDEVFKISERKRLRGKGILGFRFPNWFLTDRTKEILSLIQ